MTDSKERVKLCPLLNITRILGLGVFNKDLEGKSGPQSPRLV